jgi:hypothetical protein
VRGKEDLVIMMAEDLFARVPLPASPPGGWRAQLEAIARLQWSLYGQHPWLAPAINVTRPQMMPKGMAYTEWTLRALGGLGLDTTTRVHLAIGLLAYVRGISMSFESEASARRDTGMTDQEWMESQQAAFAAAFAAGPYPLLASLTMDPTLEMDMDSLFEVGLQSLLDGYAVRIGRTMKT